MTANIEQIKNTIERIEYYTKKVNNAKLNIKELESLPNSWSSQMRFVDVCKQDLLKINSYNIAKWEGLLNEFQKNCKTYKDENRRINRLRAIAF